MSLRTLVAVALGRCRRFARFLPRAGALGIALGLALPGPAGAAPADGQTTSVPLGANLAGLIEHLRANSPELATQRLQVDAARERAGAADALPDPRFQLELMDFTNTMGDGRTSLLPGEVGETRYRVVQPLPFWGKRELRGEVASAELQVAGARRDQTRLDLERRVKLAFASHYQARGQQTILGDTLELVAALERLVLTRYSVGLVPQQDALRAQTEMTRLKLELLDTQARRDAAHAQLLALLALDPGTALAEPQALPPRPRPPTHGELLARARDTSPDLAAESGEIVAAERARELAWRERYPDFAIGLTNNRPRVGEDSWDLMLEVEIPLQQGRRRSQEREADHRRDAAQERLRAADANLAGRLGEARAAYLAELGRADLLGSTLLPQARANLDAAIADYESGRIDFGTLIEAETQILQTRLRLLDADVAATRMLAELEMLLGADL
jgi:outer membrane protein TolC